MWAEWNCGSTDSRAPGLDSGSGDRCTTDAPQQPHKSHSGSIYGVGWAISASAPLERKVKSGRPAPATNAGLVLVARSSRPGSRAATSPVWTPDGQRVCYDSGSEVFCQAADGRGAAQALFKVDGLRNTRPFSLR